MVKQRFVSSQNKTGTLDMWNEKTDPNVTRFAQINKYLY